MRFVTFAEEDAVPVVFDFTGGPADSDWIVEGHVIENIAHCTAWLVGVGKVGT